MNTRSKWFLPVAALALVLLPACQHARRQDQPAAAATATQPAAARRPAAATAPQTIRIGAWNVEWLGSPGRRSGPAKDHAQTPQALAEYIIAADVDILGLEEIARNAEDGAWANDTIAAALRLVEEETGGKWQQRLFPPRSGRNQCCGIAWDTTKVTILDQPRPVTEPDQTSLQGKPLWSRPPYGTTFSAGEGLTDFVVIVIHMKSNYGGDFAFHRAEEAVHLMHDLPETYTDRDVVIIGDSNCGTHDEPAVAAIESAGFVDLNAADIPTHWKYGALDRAFVPEEQPEFAHRYFEVLNDGFRTPRGLSEQDFKVAYSDHFMVITDVTVMADDD